MRILIAPDKFKGTFSAADVTRILADTLREELPGAELRLLPIADGGEGTAEILAASLHDTAWKHVAARDPLGRPVSCRFLTGRDPAGKRIAVVEASEASGYWRVQPGDRNVPHSSTFGTGELLRHAAQENVDEILLGLGGSATNDAGAGMAAALGYRFLDAQGDNLDAVPALLIGLDRILSPSALGLPPVTALNDVSNPLLGPAGSTAVFAPQKGARPEELSSLEETLSRIAAVAQRDLGTDFSATPGAGAAGGLGFGALTFCKGILRPGFDTIAARTGLESSVAWCDTVVTGEGCLDAQSLHGKAPFQIATLARRHGKRTCAVVGCCLLRTDHTGPFEHILSLRGDGTKGTEADLIKAARKLAALLRAPASP